ncbi:hypothetical protein ACLMJK_006981 [Lecanora helva]
MFSIKILPALLFPYFDLVSAALVSSPLGLNSVNNNVNLTLAEFASFSNLTAPLPPPGYIVEVLTNEKRTVKPIETYQDFIQLMSLLALFTWGSTFSHSLSMTDREYTTQISIYPMPRDSQLKNSVAITALYDLGCVVAVHNKFYELQANLLLDEVTRGVIQIYNKPPGASPDTLLLDQVADSNTTLMANPTKGGIVDPKDRKLIVTFEFDGVKLNSKDIFTSFLNAFAISSEQDNSKLNAAISAAPSAYDGKRGGDVVLSTWSSVDPDDNRMTWSRLKRALLIIWTRIVMEDGVGTRPRFEGFYFGIEYAGVEIGAGRLIKIDSATNGTDRTAVAR